MAKLVSKRAKKPKSERKPQKKARRESFKIYIYRLLKSCHRDMEISQKAMSCMNSFVMDMFERLAGEASRLSSISKRSTISTTDIQCSVDLVIGKELAKHAKGGALRHLHKYAANRHL